MPMLIPFIDAIARQKQRDVLHLEFCPEQDGLDWAELPVRQQIIDWLTAHGIGWMPCGPFANVRVMESYRGQLYIDLPYDKALPAYQALEAFLENPDGSMRFPQVDFYCLTLDLAMKNAAHDAPGFWESWAEKF